MFKNGALTDLLSCQFIGVGVLYSEGNAEWVGKEGKTYILKVKQIEL